MKLPLPLGEGWGEGLNVALFTWFSIAIISKKPSVSFDAEGFLN